MSEEEFEDIYAVNKVTISIWTPGTPIEPGHCSIEIKQCKEDNQDCEEKKGKRISYWPDSSRGKGITNTPIKMYNTINSVLGKNQTLEQDELAESIEVSDPSINPRLREFHDELRPLPRKATYQYHTNIDSKDFQIMNNNINSMISDMKNDKMKYCFLGDSLLDKSCNNCVTAVVETFKGTSLEEKFEKKNYTKITPLALRKNLEHDRRWILKTNESNIPKPKGF